MSVTESLVPSLPLTPARLVGRLSKLRNGRRRRQKQRRMLNPPRRALADGERREILAKTRRHCHVCGGKIIGRNWVADHVRAYRRGGPHALDNYLAAHKVCNGLRWDYSPQEVQWILAIGSWARLEMERGSEFGTELVQRFHASQTRKRRRGEQQRDQPGT